MTHAATGRRRGACDKRGDRLPAIGFDPFSCLFLSRAADLANHDDAVRIRIVIEHSDHIEMRRPVDWIAANANASGLTNTALGKLPDRLVGQRAAPRDNADVAALMNVAGGNPDPATAMGILAF